MKRVKILVPLVIPRGKAVQLTEHFNSSEFDCKCVLSTCTETLIAPHHLLQLQKLRDRLGKITVLSGMRCHRHNRFVGGRAISRHLPQHADATDITFDNISYDHVTLISEFFNGIGYYKNSKFFHVDSREARSSWISVL